MPVDDELPKNIEKNLGYTFRDKKLITQALTHSSSRGPDRPCNERFEFLGDSVIGHIVSEHLFHEFPEYEEGELSGMKSVLVSSKTFGEVALELEIEKMLILGKGIKGRKHLPHSILSDAFEAVIAAVYLDGGYDEARQVVIRRLKPKMTSIMKDQYDKNHKSLLQDYAQKTLATMPVYRVAREVGPDHRKMFQVIVVIKNDSYGPAWGRSKKEAEQRAAKVALKAIQRSL